MMTATDTPYHVLRLREEEIEYLRKLVEKDIDTALNGIKAGIVHMKKKPGQSDYAFQKAKGKKWNHVYFAREVLGALK